MSEVHSLMTDRERERERERERDYLCSMLLEIVLAERICRAQPTKLLASSSLLKRCSLSASVNVFESRGERHTQTHVNISTLLISLE